jgi:hypothetical protein
VAGDLNSFMRWCHPDLLVERLRHASACWLVLQALDLDLNRHPAPAEGSISVIDTPSGPLGISSMLLPSSADPPLRVTPFPLEPSRAPLWVLALLQQQDSQGTDPLDPQQWLFWVVPAAQFHAERRSIALQPLVRAHGEGLDWAGLQAALIQPR